MPKEKNAGFCPFVKSFFYNNKKNDEKNVFAPLCSQPIL